MKKRCDDRPMRQYLPCYSAGDDKCYGPRLFGIDKDAKPSSRVAVAFCRYPIEVELYLKNGGRK